MNDQPDRDSRPSPEALLEQANGESRGRLKIFLGAAPGVGKTYEMLIHARRRRLDGVDAVVGVVETHGRVETDLLTKGFEIVPKKRLLYKARVLPEMDLDAILQRRPKLVLVDELAHSNAPGSRHPKRYMDVQELLAAGIDVFTTLNVQHIESLNDVVAKITRIRVRETVPDSIIDRADEIELVDLTPEDLIQRLKEGKVYVPQQAERAVRHYFQPGNLTALRELALRRTAERVDTQMLSYMKAHAIAGPWAASERVLVCVNEHPGAASIVRYARRLADRMRASWTALHIETSRSLSFSEAECDRVAESLRLAEKLGGEAVTMPATSVVAGVLDYARSNNVTHIIIAKSHRSRWVELLRRSVTHRLIRNAGDISVHVIAEEPVAETVREQVGAPRESRGPRQVGDLNPYSGSLAMVAGALGVSLLMQQLVGTSNVDLVFLTTVLTSAVVYGFWPSVFACLVSILAYNFFFLPPLYTFTIADPENVVALFFFALVAIIGGNLTARVRAQAVVARQRAKTTEGLYLFSRKLSGAATLDDVLWATAYQIALMLNVRVVLLLPEGESVSVRAGYPPEDTLDEADLAAAKWAWQHGQPAGRDADTLPGAKRLFFPMRTGRAAVGVIGIDSDRPGALLSPDQRRLLDALVDQAALAIERIGLARDVDQARLAAETDRLRAALLTSISHDLRTPLASILGSATSLKSYRRELSENDQNELIDTIQEEAERLNRFIANLLDMTRLESGAIEPRLEVYDVGDLVGSALEQARKVLMGHKVVVDLAPNLPMLRVDPVLFGQALFNLLDNAAKYAPTGTEILVRGRLEAGVVRLEILDEGSGIPPENLERIFDKFYRVHAGDRKRAGTGLGLAICRGFVEAMGGAIVAGNRPDKKGAVFTVRMPAAPDVLPGFEKQHDLGDKIGSRADR